MIEQVDSDESHDMLKYFLDDYKSEKPKSFFNVNIMYSDSQAILIGATFVPTGTFVWRNSHANQESGIQSPAP